MKTFIRIHISLLAAFVFIFSSINIARAVEGLPPGTDEALENLQATMYPPWVYDIKISPEKPVAGEDITITASIYNDGAKTMDKTVSATLMYSLDRGDTWERIDMDEEADNRLWRGTIPAQESGAEILYGFQAEDTSGNIYTETPCLVLNWPPQEDSCLFNIAVDEPPVEDPDILIPGEFDILGMKAGVDEDNLYVEITVRDDISPGTISPIFVHLYGIGIANPDKGDPNDLVSQGFLGVYAPAADAFSYYQCMTVYRKGDAPFFDKSNIECATDGKSKLWFKVSNRQIGETPGGYIKMMAADGAITSITPLAGAPYDYTHVTTVAFKERWLDID